MARRSNVIVVLGLAVFMVGAAATYFLVRDSGGGSGVASSVTGGVPVLYAADNIPAGTSGSSALDAGLVKSKNVTAAAKPASALTDASQLTGRTTAGGVPQGSVLTDQAFPVAQTRVGTVQIPPGLTAIALNMPNVPGVAGYAGAGDRIDIYAVPKPGGAGEGRLIQQNVEILSVNGANLTPSPGQPGAPDRVFLVAVGAAQAEQLAYLSSSANLYFSLVPKDQPPVPPTPGVDAASAMQPR